MGIAARPPSGSYLQIAPQSGLTIKVSVNTLAGVIDPDYTDNIVVVMHNFGTVPKTFQCRDKIAQLIVEHASTPDIVIVKDLMSTARNSNGFGSTDTPVVEMGTALKKYLSQPSPSNIHELPDLQGPPDKIPTAATTAAVDLKATNDLHLVFRMPFDIDFSSSPLDNQRFCTVATFGQDKYLGFNLWMCKKFGLPQIIDCKKSTLAAQQPCWQSELHDGYITWVNRKPVSNLAEIAESIEHVQNTNAKEVKTGIATIAKSSMHSQLGVLQLYHDQLSVVGNHLWQLRQMELCHQGSNASTLSHPKW